MGKVKGEPEPKKRKKMADMIAERRTTGLKRSKSVRASLRSIGTRIFHPGKSYAEHQRKAEALHKATSMSSLDESRKEFKKSIYKSESEFQPEMLFSGNTILKTPVNNAKEKRAKKKQYLEYHFPFVPNQVPPKAAQILQIPIRENYETVSFRYEQVFGGRGVFEDGTQLGHRQGVESDRKMSVDDPKGIYEDFAMDYRQNRFHRSSIRLSMTKKRSHARNYSMAAYSKLPSLGGDSDMENGLAQSLKRAENNFLHFGDGARPAAGRKTSKKEAKLLQQRLEKVNIHLQALFAAVEHGHLEKARTILDSTDVDVNSVNCDGLTPLDVAVLSNNRPLVKMLVCAGAKEGNRFSSPDKLGSHLKQLLGEAELRLQELGGLLDEPCAQLNTRASFSSIIGSAYQTSAMAGCAGGDTEKQAIAWGRKAKQLKRLVLGFNQARPPDAPSLVAVDITSSTSVAVRLYEPKSTDSPITTKYKVQWSTRPDFSIITGETEILDLSKPNCSIDLTQGRKYFFRASCGNLKGFGAFITSIPNSVIPSCWREVNMKKSRFEGRLEQLECLLEEVRRVRPGTEMLETPNPQRRMQRKKTTIKQLFTAASKFQKNLRRGIYLACILYHEDKVLVTNEDFLPVIEIDETFPNCMNMDMHWLMKVSYSWDDIKSLKADMEKHTSSAVHFRIKLLTAALQMQSSLCLQDLGQLFYKPLRDCQDTVVLSTVNYIKNPKSVSVLNSRWLPMNKVFKKPVIGDVHSISEILMGSIQEQINYHQVSSLKLNRGLYLAFLKMQSSVDLIQVVVPSKSPNMLPHCRVRENPHVSAEEWDYLKRQHLPDIVDNSSEQQKNFLDLITSAAKRLFNYMDISPDDSMTHRLYDLEVIDLTEDVSFILVCPSAELSCSVPGQREILLQRGDLLSLPIQVFEMIHLNTYQHQIVKKYSKLSCFLELDSATANHLHRGAFSKSEVALAKEKLEQLQDFQKRLGNMWKAVRWLMDVITFARDKNSNGISMRYILEKETEENSSPKRMFLQIPQRDSKVVKSSPGRGSWPGPGGSQVPPSTLLNEFSKSEQQLSMNETSSQYMSACSDTSRKNSDSYNSDYFNDKLPPSRSEDTLYIIPNGATNQRIRANTVSSLSATTSPLLGVRANYGGSMVSVNTMNTTNTSDSLHSLSSDSDPSMNPMGSSTPQKKIKSSIAPSKSMTNVKQHTESNCTKSNKLRPRNLKLDTLTPSNLETSLSRSLNNIKTVTDIDVTATSYLKPLDSIRKSDIVSENLFKVPFLEEQSSSKDSQAGILQVYAAYDTGLATGTSLKLHVTPKTTAREVVDLVVQQLNMAVMLKGKEGPIYSTDKLKNFCLVAVIGARERCLRDDFRPLQLQNPWRKGRLYVRQKQDVLAALEHSSRLGAVI
ncbi:uncharacterized protein LOC123683318 isoform X2 [Harmonia axyridis]|uniref:uncharacterized protein LOC123683318 isoform X2 n=1 Tax=Harmonia axyridis TaxID=115357 RepID=UPI001E275EA5|nr:uncharacterized protein LOC123683318 isoform X2 [Harmonia axyridis]